MRLIFEKSIEGRRTSYIKKPNIEIKDPKEFIPPHLLRESLDLPSLGELDVVRHFTNLAMRNFSVDTHFYPLGSCTMKYNPKISQDLVTLKEFQDIHPYQNEEDFQGLLEIIYNLEKLLCILTGMKRFSFQVTSGAHAELAGMLIVSAYFRRKKEKRYKVIVPDSSHGTNPASAAMCGYQIVVIKSTTDGLVDVDELEKTMDEDTAGLMLTNPNTLGLFEERILDIQEIVHKKGGLLYYDGANFNALLGITTPASMGFDVIHLNLHKTFSSPHGSGGPGAGALGVSEKLVDFLPTPIVDKSGDRFYLNYDIKNSIGRMRTFYGNIPALIRAYVYLLRLGKEGLKRVAQISVLNANYIREKLKDVLEVASPKKCMHEVVFSCKKQKEEGVTALDIAKRLIDYGIHPPTMYFPLIVKEALMVEPTETESKEILDYFIETLRKIVTEEIKNSTFLKEAPFTTIVKRVDETKAARFPVLRWRNGDSL